MTRPSPPEPSLDFRRITFPSDRITIGTLRAAHPHIGGSPTDGIPEDSDVNALLGVEREFALRAFRKALGRSRPPSRDGDYRRELASCLDDGYVRYGLSSGPHDTEVLLRGIEAQAAGQAREWIGRSR
jgi:hypothetical protein